MHTEFDIIVIGGGHAGIEAVFAGAKLGLNCCLLTPMPEHIGQMSCNPAIGGLAKGQMVREIDALGGLMAELTDQTGIQFRILNRSKGPAVWAPRVQTDRFAYSRLARKTLESTPGITILAELADKITADNGRVTGVICQSGKKLATKAIVLTAGTFMRGMMHVGTKQFPGGRYDEPAADAISQSLLDLGITLGRLKTGTPARIAADSIDYSKLQRQDGDENPEPLSFLNDKISQKQVCCWITWTNERTHQIIRDNLHQAPLYTGQITGVGPRYCPSIETKIVRFSDKDRHQVFLEPESLETDWIYCNGISNALPREVQDDLLQSIPGLENCRIHRYAYAIEYDFLPPTQLLPTLETKAVAGLYCAGQVNGTSGYEEAAGQGLMAGLNAGLKLLGRDPATLRRDQSYIGVMIDDLVTKGVDEPYRMFTSRAEHRLLLRSDNADARLTPLGRQWGLVDDHRWDRFTARQEKMAGLKEYLVSTNYQGRKLDRVLCQQDHDENWLLEAVPELAARNLPTELIRSVIWDIRYAGYIEKENKLVSKSVHLEKIKLRQDTDYDAITQLRNEARQRLKDIRPLTLAQAARIIGITPADITVLMIHLKK